MGRWIRHGWIDGGLRGAFLLLCPHTLPVAALAFAMIQASFLALLMAGVGSAELLEAGTSSTRQAAVTLTAVTTPTEIEEGLAPAGAAETLSQRHALAGNGAGRHELSTRTGQRHPLLSRLKRMID